jgi:hypothetical protein
VTGKQAATAVVKVMAWSLEEKDLRAAVRSEVALGLLAAEKGLDMVV